MKIIFAGTTEFGIPTLEKLQKRDTIQLVITQPDRPSGRKKELASPPIKTWAEKNNIPVEQPEKISVISEKIRSLEPDLLVVVAYGQIIPREILDIPKFGAINIHGSLLPKYRGASPIQAALLNGDEETGITLIKMDEKMDNGPMVAMVHVPIEKNETFERLYARLAQIAADLLAKTLPGYFSGEIKPQVQNHGLATFTQLISKNDARVKWTNPAKSIHNQVRALNPEPGTWTMLDGKSVKIIETETLIDNKIELPGKIYRLGPNLAVKCGDYSLKILTIQPEGKKSMAGSEFLNGLKNLETKIFI